MQSDADSPRHGDATPMDEADDAAVAAAVLAGDRDAFGILVNRYQNHVYRLAVRLSNGDRERASDLAQEAFLRAYRGLAGFGFDARFGTWLHRVTMNVAISQTRRERALKRGTTVSLDAPLDGDEDGRRAVAARTRTPDAETVGDETSRLIFAAIDALDDDLKHLVLLVNLEGYSYDDAATILHIPVGTVRSRLHRARELLAQKLKRDSA